MSPRSVTEGETGDEPPVETVVGKSVLVLALSPLHAQKASKQASISVALRMFYTLLPPNSMWSRHEPSALLSWRSHQLPLDVASLVTPAVNAHQVLSLSG